MFLLGIWTLVPSHAGLVKPSYCDSFADDVALVGLKDTLGKREFAENIICHLLIPKKIGAPGVLKDWLG